MAHRRQYPVQARKVVPKDPDLVSWYVDKSLNDSRTLEFYGDAAEAEACFTRPPATALQAIMESAPGFTPEESSEERLDRIGLQYEAATAAMEQLPEKLREAFSLHALSGYSYSEIAELLGVSKPTVGRWVLDARQRLLEALSPEEGT